MQRPKSRASERATFLLLSTSPIDGWCEIMHWKHSGTPWIQATLRQVNLTIEPSFASWLLCHTLGQKSELCYKSDTVKFLDNNDWKMSDMLIFVSLWKFLNKILLFWPSVGLLTWHTLCFVVYIKTSTLQIFSPGHAAPCCLLLIIFLLF